MASDSSNCCLRVNCMPSLGFRSSLYELGPGIAFLFIISAVIVIFFALFIKHLLFKSVHFLIRLYFVDAGVNGFLT